MASVEVDEETGRRTRSGRKVNTTPVATRNTRRSTRKTQELIEQTEVSEDKSITEDSPPYAQSDIIKEMLAEAAQGVLVAQQNTEEDNIQYTEISDVSEIHDIETVEEVEVTDISDTIETSGNEVDVNIQYSDDQMMPQDDEKSSSFPFGSVQQSENSDGRPDENIVTNISECVDSSLLASLVGDNANSLPSAGEESQSKDNFESAVTNEIDLEKNIDIPQLEINCEDSDSKSEPAIAEELPNGETTSQKTIADTDAEMVSEDELPVSVATEPKVADVETVSDEEFQTPTKPVDTDAISDEETSLITIKAKVKDAEVVSEDELPAPVKEKVTDAEEVSDDELPGPASAELPADTEVVSEDELPSSVKKTTKRKADADEEYNPSSPTGEDSELPDKKVKLDSDEDKDKEKKKLPELDKYWKAVNDDPADFTGWTYLLQYVDQENDIDAAREAYDAFLAHYPYCYGYWRKYADYEKRKGNKQICEEVFERGLKAIPLSVDLWIHYLTHVKSSNSDNEEFIRSQFERALLACGLEFRSDKLWEAYIKWELEGKRYLNVSKIYDRLLATPTQGYNAHFDSYQDLINNHSAAITVDIEEFKKFRTEVRETLKQQKNEKDDKDGKDKDGKDKDGKDKDGKDKDGKDKDGKDKDSKDKDDKDKDDKDKDGEDKDKDTVENDDTQEPQEPDDHVRNDEEMCAIKDKIISSRRKIHKLTVNAVTARWTYEEGIKRPYFHVKPLERCQLKNWKDYLDFEIEKGDRKRILILFERCLIACALYDEFWLKLIRYLESQNDTELIPIIHDVFDRACTIHHPDKPCLHLMWSAFEECQNNFDKAADILKNLENQCPNLLQIAYRRINLERRRGDLNKCKELYEHYIATSKNKNISGSLAIKYARFLHKICGNLDEGYQILKQTLEKDSSNTRIALQMIDLALQRDKVDENEIVQIMDKFMSRDNMDPEQKVLFAQRKVEFLEDFGSTAKGLQDAQRALQIALNKANEAKKKSESSPNKKSSSTKESTTNLSTTSVTGQTPTSTYNNNYTNYSSNPQYYGSNQQSYQSYDSYGYNHWQQSQYGYSGYGQWSGYGSYY